MCQVYSPGKSGPGKSESCSLVNQFSSLQLNLTKKVNPYHVQLEQQKLHNKNNISNK